MFGKLRPFSITLDTSKQKKSRDPGPSTMPEAPTIPIPPGKGEYPSCCTICTRRFYHDLALLQLPEDVEKATLSNFHGAYDVHAAQPAKGSNSKQEAFRFRSAPPSKKRYEQKERSSETGQTLTSYDKNMIKSVGLSWWRVDQVVKKSGSKVGKFGLGSDLGAAGEALGMQKDETPLGHGDILTRLEVAAVKSARVSEAYKKDFVGQQGTGPCCNICPTWFIPHQHPKTWSRDGPGISSASMSLDVGGRVQPQLIELGSTNRKKSAARSTPLKSNGGFSQCCNVCVDGAYDRRDPNGLSFLEVKALTLATTEQQEKLRVQARLKHKLFLAAMSRSAPPRPGMCCYMCTVNANNGWDGSDPFQEPMSEAQSSRDQTFSEDNMRKVAHYRTYYHPATVDHKYQYADKKKM